MTSLLKMFKLYAGLMCWLSNPETALFKFNKEFLSLIDKHAPLKKFTVRNNVTPWLDDELKDSMKITCQMKRTAVTAGNKCDWDVYRKMRNSVTKLNKKKKKIYFDNHVKNISNDNRKLWNVLNQLTGKKNKINPSFLETGDKLITNPMYIANHLNDYFILKKVK